MTSQPLGQHFLKNKSAITKIVAALELKKGDSVIEVGPGKGALTIPLAKECLKLGCKIVAIEKDAKLAFSVQGLGFSGEILKVRVGDALTELPRLVGQMAERQDPAALRPLDGSREMATAYKVVGNIPYYITGHLLRIIGELPVKPTLTILMVQKEVAERVSAGPGKMNLLAAATQIWADISVLFTLQPTDFNPPPEVESAVIKLRTANSEQRTVDAGKYYKFIHAAFKQPRKTLLNNLTEQATSESRIANREQPRDIGKQNSAKRQKILTLLIKFGFDEKTRTQELSVEQMLELGEALSSSELRNSIFCHKL